MGHSIPDVLGVEQCGVEKPKGKMLACNMAMGRDGMSEHATRQAMNMLEGSPRTLPMASGESPFGLVEMGSMFTVLKVPDELACCDHSDPGCCKHLPAMWRALSVATPNSAARWLTRSPQAEVGTLVPAFGIEPVNPDFAVRVAGIRADA